MEGVPFRWGCRAPLAGKGEARGGWGHRRLERCHVRVCSFLPEKLGGGCWENTSPPRKGPGREIQPRGRVGPVDERPRAVSPSPPQAPQLAFPTRPGEALRSAGGLLGPGAPRDLESMQAFLSDTKLVV